MFVIICHHLYEANQNLSQFMHKLSRLPPGWSGVAHRWSGEHAGARTTPRIRALKTSPTTAIILTHGTTPARRSVYHGEAVVVHRHRHQTVWHGHRHAPLSWRNHHDYCDIVAYSAHYSYSADAQSADPAVAPVTKRYCLHVNVNYVDDDCCVPRSVRNCAIEIAPLAMLCPRCGICELENC